MAEPIERCVDDWHRHLRGELPGGLDAILADDVVFLSPIVFSPQRGKEITRRYLEAAAVTIGGEPQRSVADTTADARPRAFRYVKQVCSGNHAVLEFETEIDGTHVNGVDILTCDEDGRIVEFKVMIRPLRAINLIHQQMAAMLERMQAASSVGTDHAGGPSSSA